MVACSFQPSDWAMRDGDADWCLLREVLPPEVRGMAAPPPSGVVAFTNTLRPVAGTSVTDELNVLQLEIAPLAGFEMFGVELEIPGPKLDRCDCFKTKRLRAAKSTRPVKVIRTNRLRINPQDRTDGEVPRLFVFDPDGCAQSQGSKNRFPTA